MSEFEPEAEESEGYYPSVDESFDYLEDIYDRRKNLDFTIVSAEQWHTLAISRETYASFMDWIDAGYENETLVQYGTICSEFEYSIAKWAGELAAKRLTSIADLQLPPKKLFRKVPSIEDQIGVAPDQYASEVTTEVIKQMRDYDDVFVSQDWQDLKEGRSAAEITLKYMQDFERKFYL